MLKEWEALSKATIKVIDFYRDVTVTSSGSQHQFYYQIYQCFRIADFLTFMVFELSRFKQKYSSAIPEKLSELLSNHMRFEIWTLEEHTLTRHRFDESKQQLMGTPEPPLEWYTEEFKAKVLHAKAVNELALWDLYFVETTGTYLLSSYEEELRLRVDNAFAHLQRLIVVDNEFQKKWKNHFDTGGEIELEKLGALHLLWHHIWSFKANTEGGRTDLIMGGPIDKDEVNRAAEGLVMTEWKRRGKEDTDDYWYDSARRQGERYTKGPLFGIELKKYRYAVVVSLGEMKPRDDDYDEQAEVTWRYINIALNQKIPSKGGRDDAIRDKQQTSAKTSSTRTARRKLGQ